MPIYEFECKHSHRTEVGSRVEDRPNTVVCMACGGVAHRVISLPVVRGDGEEYADENLSDPGSGEPFIVRGEAHKRQRLKELGLAQKEPTYRDRHNDRRGRLTFPLKVN